MTVNAKKDKTAASCRCFAQRDKLRFMALLCSIDNYLRLRLAVPDLQRPLRLLTLPDFSCGVCVWGGRFLPSRRRT